MNTTIYIQSCEHEFLLKEFLQIAVKELGTIKMNKILKDVNTSGKVEKFIIEAKRLNVRPGSDDFLGCIHSSTSFIFSKAENISIATIALLMKWNHDVGEPYSLSDKIYLNNRFFTILDKCDGYKTHTKSGPNFFQRFKDQLESVVTLQVLKNCDTTFKTEIYFDSSLFNAIISGQKTEFRVVDGMDGINLTPEAWKIHSYEHDKGAFFTHRLFNEPLLIHYPYKIGNSIKVLNSSDNSEMGFNIKITSYYIQRVREVSQSDACNEGYGAYIDQVEELQMKNPLIDAELSLFIEVLDKEYGISQVNNGWFWVYIFERENNQQFVLDSRVDIEIKQAVSSKAVASGLSAESLAQLMAVTF